METMENSAPKTLRVSHGSHSLCYWLKKSKNKKQNRKLFLCARLDIHIAVRRPGAALGRVDLKMRAGKVTAAAGRLLDLRDDSLA